MLGKSKDTKSKSTVEAAASKCEREAVFSGSEERWLAHAREVLQDETLALTALAQGLNVQFIAVLKAILECRGRAIITGVGKSGYVARKLAVSLSSTGTPAFFLHAGEGAHGDLGMVKPEDLVIVLSNSGETAEIMTLLPTLKNLGCPLVAITGSPSSTLAQVTNYHLDIGVRREAGHLGLAPTTSALAMLALGDALVAALMVARDFRAEEFARCHPGGTLGRQLLDNKFSNNAKTPSSK